MPRLTNNGACSLHLPTRAVGDDKQPAFCLEPGESRNVPNWYVEELLEEPGPAARLSRGTLVVDDDDDGGPLASLSGIKVADAGPIVAKTTDRAVLEGWRESAKRKGIKDLLDARLEGLDDGN